MTNGLRGPPGTLDEIKQAARIAALARRGELEAAPAAAERLSEAVGALLGDRPATVVSGFWPMGNEIDVRPTLALLHRRRFDVALPVVVRRGQPLLFRRWRPGDALVPGGFGTSVPAPQAEELRPAVLLVPLLAFDRAGYRLGYGGGFYDRTLALLRGEGSVTAIGVAFAAQEVEAVPRDHFDQRLDYVVTEGETIAFAGQD